MLLLAIEIAVVDFCDWKHRFDINQFIFISWTIILPARKKNKNMGSPN